MDASALDAARQSMRPDVEREAYRQAREVYGKRYNSGLMEQGHKDVATMLGEKQTLSVQAQIQKTQDEGRQKQDNRADITQGFGR